jgi:hypothetical protein
MDIFQKESAMNPESVEIVQALPTGALKISLLNFALDVELAAS